MGKALMCEDCKAVGNSKFKVCRYCDGKNLKEVETCVEGEDRVEKLKKKKVDS